MEIKINWVHKNLASTISVLESGSRPKGGASTDGGEIPSLGGENIVRSGGVSLEGVKRVPRKFYDRMTKGHLEDGDVLINKDGAQTGKVGMYRNETDGPACINEHLFLIRGRPKKITQEFLYYSLLSQPSQAQIDVQITGSAQPGLKSDFLRNVFADIPPTLTEQYKIAEILTTVDWAIEQTEALIDKQQRIKRGLIQDLLTRGIDEQGNLRSEKTHEFKDSPLGRIPVEWDYGNLGKCCNVHNDLRKPIAALIRKEMAGDYPYYGPTGILDFINEYRVDGKYVLIGEDGDHFLKFNAQEMTLLVKGKFNVNNHAHILSGNEKVVTEWLHLFFMHRDITLHLTRQGAGRLKLNKLALLSLPLAYPKEQTEQKKIVRIVNSVRSNQVETALSLSKFRSLKIALMQDLLTGTVPITPLLSKAEIGA